MPHALLAAAAAIGVAGSLPCDLDAKSVPWTFAGPAGGYVDSADPLEIASAGAAQALVKVDGAALLATANGGIWRTTSDLTNEKSPKWKPALDGQPVARADRVASRHSMSFRDGSRRRRGCHVDIL